MSLDYTLLILTVLGILLIVLCFLTVRRSLHTRDRAKRKELSSLLIEELSVLLTPVYSQLELITQELRDTKVLVDSNQRLRMAHYILNDAAKVNDTNNLLSLLLNQQQEQRALKTDIDKALTNLALEQQHVLKDVAKINDIGNLLSLMLSLEQRQRALGAEIDNSLTTAASQQQHVLKDVAKINDIGNLLSLMLSLEQRQRALGDEIDKSLTTAASQQQFLYSIVGVVQRIDRILSGAQSKGSLGEQIVGERLAQLPPEWVARNIRFPDGRIVEFGLRTPDGRLIPIDSKWTATELLDQLGQTADKARRNVLIKDIRREVINRAREVLKYLDEHRTIGFCIAAVPDPVFEHCLEPVQ